MGKPLQIVKPNIFLWLDFAVLISSDFSSLELVLLSMWGGNLELCDKQATNIRVTQIRTDLNNFIFPSRNNYINTEPIQTLTGIEVLIKSL